MRQVRRPTRMRARTKPYLRHALKSSEAEDDQERYTLSVPAVREISKSRVLSQARFVVCQTPSRLVVCSSVFIGPLIWCMLERALWSPACLQVVRLAR